MALSLALAASLFACAHWSSRGTTPPAATGKNTPVRVTLHDGTQFVLERAVRVSGDTLYGFPGGGTATERATPLGSIKEIAVRKSNDAAVVAAMLGGMAAAQVIMMGVPEND